MAANRKGDPKHDPKLTVQLLLSKHEDLREVLAA